MLASTDVWEVAALKRDAIVGLEGLVRLSVAADANLRLSKSSMRAKSHCGPFVQAA